MMRCNGEDDRTFTRNVECSSGPDLSKEQVGNNAPEKEHSVVDDVRSHLRGRWERFERRHREWRGKISQVKVDA